MGRPTAVPSRHVAQVKCTGLSNHNNEIDLGQLRDSAVLGPWKYDIINSNDDQKT